MKIYLYTVISSSSQNNLISRNLVEHIKISLHRAMNTAMWSLFDRFMYRYYHYLDFDNSNSGDIAIRVAIRELLRNHCADCDIAIEEIAWGQLTPELVESINHEDSMLVIGGSGYYHHDQNGIMNRRFAQDTEFIEQIRSKVMTFSVGMNRKLSANPECKDVVFPQPTKHKARKFTNGLYMSSVRDKYSKDVLDALCPEQNNLLIPDPALFLAAEDSGLQISPKKLAVGLNFAFHGPFCESLLKKNIHAYIDFLKRIEKKYSPIFYYFFHSDSEQVIPAILKSKGIKVEPINLPPKKMLDVYRQLDIHICQMMHSSILSINAGTPTLNLAYDRKNLSFYELMDFSEYQVNICSFDPERLEDLCKKMIAERVKLRKHLMQRKEELWPQVKNFVEKIINQDIAAEKKSEFI